MTGKYTITEEPIPRRYECYGQFQDCAGSWIGCREKEQCKRETERIEANRTEGDIERDARETAGCNKYHEQREDRD